ncbi:amino acid ABC transporter membrane protein, PAAT family (TC 3.A.1.3.-) [Butyrivibrio fibrisolvens]|uniref:Amino acid ABC transporter membrane protein, PAAT family (TC 3.A.1.3.-) n=1 Tax=Butyrivibrio fibrisolvens TaxID=831 RepID=A0A1H9XCI2_BUTFI|nr:amino acid ABC transporter permease [Butyrivibrio fibrisolvens]SES43906.1 amino acid ABC transporter membrane protein, PAAT family (TC 3.A.1.3.-) [Butyrivibrio fibrisolvens]
MNSRLLQILITSIPKILLPGITYTIPLTLISFALGMVIAILVAVTRVMQIKLLSQFFQFYVWVFRGTPMLVQLFIIFYGLPNVGINVDAFPSAIIAFSLNIGAYASETIRGSILAINKSQTEGAVACGLTIWQAMLHIVLPQAIKNCIPALFNSFISLVKDTSLAANITITEMFMATQRIVAVTYEPLALYIEVAAVYLIFSTGLTSLQKRVEKILSTNNSTLVHA